MCSSMPAAAAAEPADVAASVTGVVVAAALTDLADIAADAAEYTFIQPIPFVRFSSPGPCATLYPMSLLLLFLHQSFLAWVQTRTHIIPSGCVWVCLQGCGGGFGVFA